MKSKVLRISVLILLMITMPVIIVWATLINLLPDDKYADRSKVFSSPPPPAEQGFIPYQGPHPSQWIRTTDPYPYPIQLGQVDTTV
ncbi:MAG: hypothetical protein KBT53_05505 [Porticoccus sp.]|nr:hypothetical protein [Porticoccus sp.]MBQ0806750.1 hypothetical protein [Porticoccus sp.]